MIIPLFFILIALAIFYMVYKVVTKAFKKIDAEEKKEKLAEVIEEKIDEQGFINEAYSAAKHIDKKRGK